MQEGETSMKSWKCTFFVQDRTSSIRSVETVSANSASEAKKIIESRYLGKRIAWVSCVPA